MNTSSPLTKSERDRLTAADEAVTAAESEVSRLGRRLIELRRTSENVTQATVSPATGFARFLNAPRDAVAAASARREAAAVEMDLQSARDRLQAAVRELRTVEREVSRARTLRRGQAERNAAPTRSKPVSRSDPWSKRLGRDMGDAA